MVQYLFWYHSRDQKETEIKFDNIGGKGSQYVEKSSFHFFIETKRKKERNVIFSRVCTLREIYK